MSTPFDMAGKMLCQYNFNVIPLKPKDKIPPDGFKWEKFQTARVSEDQLDDWEDKFPDANWAVICGQISDLVVFDADDQAAYDWAVREHHLPDTPFVVKTGKGWHLYYRYPKGKADWLKKLNPKTMWGINADMRRDGNYVVAPGSVHASGKIYELQGFVDWEIVPEFDVYNVKGAGAEAQLESLDMSNVRSGTFGQVKQGNRNNTLAQYVGQLIAQTNPKLTDKEIETQALEYNNTFTPPLGLAEALRTIASVKRTDARNHPEGREPSFSSIVTAANNDMDGLKYVEDDDILDAPVPDCILNPPGIIKDVQQFMTASSVRSVPSFGTAAGIATVGSLVGQRVISETGLVTNTIIVCIGPSSCGKDAPRSAISRLLGEVSPGLLAGNDIASDAALINRLAKRGCERAIWLVDEFGMFLQGCKKPNSPKANVVKALTELHSCPCTIYTKAYADDKNNKVIPWHCNSVFGVSVPGEFFLGLADGEATNGFLGRMIIFIEPAGKRLPKKTSVITEVPPELVEQLRELHALKPLGFTKPYDNTPEQNLDLSPRPIPYTLTLSDDARELWLAKSIEYDEKQAELEETGKMAPASMYGRASEHQMRTAMIGHSAIQLGNLPYNRVISLDTMQWAVDTVEYNLTNAVRHTSLAIASTEFEAVTQTVKKAIRRVVTRSRCNANYKGSRHIFYPGATRAQLEKATSGYAPDVVKKALDKLVMSRELRLESWPPTTELKPGQKQKEIYRFTTEDLDSDMAEV